MGNVLLFSNTLFLSLHVASIYLSYFIFFIAGLAAVSYLVQNNLLKHKKVSIIFNRLPNLSFLDKLNYKSIGVGFPILTFAIISGFVSGGVLLFSRQILSLALWMLYAVILHVRLSEKLRGRKVALLSLLAFGVIIISLFGRCF